MESSVDKHSQYWDLLHSLSTVGIGADMYTLGVRSALQFSELLEATKQTVVLAELARQAGDAVRAAPDILRQDLIAAGQAASEAAIRKR